MTVSEAKELRYGDILHYWMCYRNVGPRGGITELSERWKVNGAVKTWKRNPDRIRIPIKHGLYDYSYITERNLCEFHREIDCAPIVNNGI